MNKQHLSLLTLFLFLYSVEGLANTPLKDYKLKNQTGKVFQLSELKDDYLFVSFIYTRCPVPNMCPLTMSLNRRVFRLWKKLTPKIPLRFLIVTLDPSHDSPSVMNAFRKRQGLTNPEFVFATGDEQTLSDFSAEFNALGLPSGEMIAHNSKSVLVGPGLLPLKNYKDNEWKPEEVLKDLQNLHDKGSKKP